MAEPHKKTLREIYANAASALTLQPPPESAEEPVESATSKAEENTDADQADDGS